MSTNWKCVPGEPTEAMYEAADLAADLDELPRLSRDELRMFWQAMHDAARFPAN
jgi:hypothetical protein